MPHITVSVNGKNYTVGCDEGEEDHVRDLASYVNKHVNDLAGSVGQVGDARLLLMAGLLVADELSDILGRVDELEAEINNLRAGRGSAITASGATEATAAAALQKAAARIKDIAGKLSPA